MLLKSIVLFIFVLFFNSCANKNISKKELQNHSYFINTPCQKLNDSNQCSIKSKIIYINNKEASSLTKNNQEYFRLKKGTNTIKIESEFYDVPYIFETKVQIDTIEYSNYTLKYKINSIQKDKLEVKYQLVSNNIIIEEFTPKYMRSKENGTFTSKIKEYSIVGLKSMLLIINIALDVAYLVK